MFCCFHLFLCFIHIFRFLLVISVTPLTFFFSYFFFSCWNCSLKHLLAKIQHRKYHIPEMKKRAELFLEFNLFLLFILKLFAALHWKQQRCTKKRKMSLHFFSTPHSFLEPMKMIFRRSTQRKQSEKRRKKSRRFIKIL